jgi:uncharacterized protein GlcG (DUF336 family)
LRIRKRSAIPVAMVSVAAVVLMSTSSASVQTSAQLPTSGSDCSGLPSHDELEAAVTQVVEEGGGVAGVGGNGGLGFHMWATVVNRDGYVCAVAYSGPDRDSQWPGSRIISAQKAYTANAFSQPPDGIGGGPVGLFQGLSLSTANLYSAVQPGGSLYGLQHSNPIDAAAAYSGDPTRAGEADDPLVGQKIGGVNVFGGGLALYTGDDLIGALGVSGDTSCTDHVIAWKMRDGFELDNIPNGVLPKPVGGDNIIYDRAIGPVPSASGFGHPQCVPPATAEGLLLPVTNPLGGGLLSLTPGQAERLLDRVPADFKGPVPGLKELLRDRPGLENLLQDLNPNLPILGR